VGSRRGEEGEKERKEICPSLGQGTFVVPHLRLARLRVAMQIIDFLQSFMDACFLQLLQHPPSHKLLQSLQAHITEEATFSDLLEQLRGPLEPFAVGHQKAVREAAIPEKEKERQKQKGDWRQRRAGAPSVIGAVGAIGVYQVEELVL